MKYSPLLTKMRDFYIQDAEYAVRSKKFIGMLEERILDDIWDQLTPKGKKNLKKGHEVEILQDAKIKNVDIAIIDPNSGPLITVGIRSQMNSIAKNTLTYFQDIRGELTGLIQRYPLSVHGYVYMHPKEIIDAPGKKYKKENINHSKYARIAANISGRGEEPQIIVNNSHLIRNSYDFFSYFVADFDKESVVYKDNWEELELGVDLSLDRFVDNIIKTCKRRFYFTGYF